MSHPDKIELTIEEKSYLQALIESKEVAPRVSDRAKILLLHSEGVSPSEIRRRLHMMTRSVQLCLDKFKAGGLMRALQDDQRSGHPKEISEEAMQWIIQTAKKSPRTLGYEQDLISGQSLYFTNMCSSTQKRRVFQGWSASLLRPCPGS